jgi:integrase
MKLTLTQGAIAKVKRAAAGKSDLIAWDDTTHGFGLRVRGDSLVWVFQYKIGDQHRRMKLGTVAEKNCAQARKLAEAQRGRVSDAKLGHGVDPALEREKKKQESKPKPRLGTLGPVIADYLEVRKGTMKARSLEQVNHHLDKLWAPLHGLPANGIDRSIIAAEIRTIAKRKGPIAANRARASLSAFFRWAIGEGLCDDNPVTGTNKQEESGPRERSLSDTEAATVWLAAPEESDYGRIVRLLLLTGCRRDEIGSLQWSEIDTKGRTITLPKERTKNGREHVVPLSDKALKIIKDIPRRAERAHVFGSGEGGFSGWSKAKAALDKAAKLKEAWRLHDLRRTAATRMGDLGVQPHVIEAILNHVSGHKAGVAGVYNRSTYGAEKKAALDLWASHLMVAVAQATGANVTALRKA